jgi:hypothetical protein
MGATNQGRVYVVIMQGKYVQTSAHARVLGRGPLVWLAQTAAAVAVLSTGMTAPEARTEVETEEILSTWLEHGDLRHMSTVARRLSAICPRQVSRQGRQT